MTAIGESAAGAPATAEASEARDVGASGAWRATTRSTGGSAGPHHRILIVGAGFAGLGTAVRLRQAGIEDFALIEKAGGVGGTWEANAYPGCQCDVPSHLYSLSFAPNPDWTRTFSTQPEIQAYLERVADEHRLRPKICFGVEMQGADWDDDEQLWRIETSAGPRTAEMLVSGMGALSVPSLPDIEGLSSFAGPMFHSARWDRSVDLKGKKVAVIGTGASSIQIVPKIQGEVAELLVFQRTPPWIMPHSDRPISSFERSVYRALPIAQRLMRQGIYWARELYVLPFLRPALARPGESIARRHLERQVKDPELRAKLTPRYRMGCKRVLISNEYYPAVQRENVRLVTERIERFGVRGVITDDGAHHEVDVVVLSTGFHVTDMPFASIVRGRDGRTLAECWAGSPRAHLGTTVSGFPNLFLMLGPYTGLGHTSVVFMIECQIQYLMDCIATMERRRIRAIEPKRDAEEAFVVEMDRRAEGTVWTSGGCNSWYLDSNGKASSLWPGPTWDFKRRLRRFNPSQHVLRMRTLPDTDRAASAVR